SVISASSIRVLKPNVSQDEALRTFSAANLSSLYWRMRGGRLRRIADVYVPFRMYRVNYEIRKASYTRLFAIDAVDGSLDLFTFSRAPAENEFVIIDTRNRLTASSDHARIGALLYDKVLRVIFQQGFFKLREPKLQLLSEPGELHVPYWLAFYGNRVLRCRAMDAVRRRIEGAKASAFFE